MEDWQKDWLKPETIERLAAGFIFGATVAVYILLRVLKSGLIVFGDKAKLIAENGVLIAQKAELEKDLAEALKEIDHLKAAR